MSWRSARALEQLDREMRARFPGMTIWTVGDADHRSRPSDHNPDDHDDDASTPSVVSAHDYVGRAQALWLWNHITDAEDKRVEYVIHDGQITGEDYGWEVQPYTGSNPHETHTHVSVGRGSDSDLTRPDLFDDDSPWGVAPDDGDVAEPEPEPEPDNWTETIVENLPTLSKRDDYKTRESDEDRRAQGLLAAAGVLSIKDNTVNDRFDGQFGPSTESATRTFQAKRGLKVDGIIGPNTWTALLGG